VEPVDDVEHLRDGGPAENGRRRAVARGRLPGFGIAALRRRQRVGLEVAGRRAEEVAIVAERVGIARRASIAVDDRVRARIADVVAGPVAIARSTRRRRLPLSPLNRIVDTSAGARP
jgi:hypothetical protein